MRALHVLKTSSGARWAALQVRELVRAGIDVHVALPSLEGRSMDLWIASGAQLHAVDLNLPVNRPWRIPRILDAARELVERIRPDLIHSHFVATTLTLRAALGRHHRTPRFFQVPGPLHLEHAPYRTGEIASAGSSDHWIASSCYTRDLYREAGVPPERISLSYYPLEETEGSQPVGLRERLGIPHNAFVVGNCNMFYRPKRYLGQFRGLKAHEDVIEALQIALRTRADVYGVLIGGAWGSAAGYFEKLRRRAEKSGRIFLPGMLAPSAVRSAWREFDCAVHVPLSENCGGVVEPLAAGVPVVAGRVGGLPEVVIEGQTGLTVPVRQPRALADAILAVAANSTQPRAMARAGRRLVTEMFSARRTGEEIRKIYEHVLGARPRPSEFDSVQFLLEGHATSTQAGH